MPKKRTYGVRRRGDKWTAKPYIPGHGHVWAGTHPTEEAAVEAALAKIRELERLPAHQETVATFAARWTRDFPRPKDSTNDRYQSDADRFASAHGHRKLGAVTVPIAREYVRKHPHDHGALRAMFSDARREGLVGDNPFSKLGISRGRGRKDIVVLTEEELDTLAELALRVHGSRPDEFGPVFRAFVLFGSYTGLRPGEIEGLDKPDVDFEAEEIHVRQQYHKRRVTLPKSNRTRRVYLPPPAAEALRSMPRHIGEHLFAGKLGQRIGASALSSYWKPVRTAFEASLPPERLAEFERVDKSLDFYSVTRHYCATYLIEQGVESWIVARQLGHEDGGRLVEQLYGHPRDQVARERLKRAFGQNVEPLRPVDREAESA